METGKTLVDVLLVEPLRAAANTAMTYVPSIAGALAIFLVGWLVAMGIERAILEVLKVLTLDKLAEKAQISGILAKGGIRGKLSELIARIAYWIVMLAFVMASLDALNLTVAAELLQSVVAFLPQVVAALFILVIGIFAAAFLGTTVRTAASNAGILQSQLLAQIVQTVIVISASVGALQQLQIPFFGEVFLIILAGISLGCAIAFGLGCKDLAGRWVGDVVEQIQGRKR
jgi:hypothetical protein